MIEKINDRVKNSYDKQIDLSSLHINDEETGAIIQEIFQKKPNCEEFLLGSNDITDAGIKILTEKLMNFENLAFIDLQYNKISLTGAEEIYSLKMKHPHLDINLFGNKITNAAHMAAIEEQYSGKKNHPYRM